ncbi:MAG TPA: hypothetical protein VFQ22_07305, partial [Longimicrobiales bacterium]|nr:hypothetical protein [Longimicrobiales bacterium]
MSPHPGGARLATVTIPAPDLSPEAFLGHAEGVERGLWSRGGRWVAHRGVVAELRAGGAPGADRFEEVGAAARALAREPLLPEGVTRPPRVRFYGGFAFRPDHRGEGGWSDFLAWLFHLPEYELEGEESGDAWLRA